MFINTARCNFVGEKFKLKFINKRFVYFLFFEMPREDLFQVQ